MRSSSELAAGDHRPKQNDGKRPNEGPPDLDQMWRDFTARLSRLFGGSGGPGGFKPGARGAGIGIAIITCVLLLLWMLSGYFVVPEGQTAVVTTFGKLSRSASTGVNWHWPYPVQGHELVPTSDVRTFEVGSRKASANDSMLTEDQNIVGVQLSIQYKIKDPVAWLYNNNDNEGSLRQVAETALREAVGKAKMDAVLYGGHEKLVADVSAAMQQMLDRYKAGVQIVGVSVQSAEPPEQVQGAFDEVSKAGQDAERFKNEGLAHAAETLPRAKGTAARLAQEADAYRTNVVINAEGDTARFKQVLAEYQKAPAVTRDRMYLDTMQQIFTNTTKVMVDAKNGNSLIYLPIDKLLAQSQAGDNGPKGTVTISTPTQTSPAPEAAQAQQPAADASQAAQQGTQSADSQHTRDLRARDSRDREGR